MNVKLLAAAAGIAALAVTGAQAQTASPGSGTSVQQKGTMGAGSGTAGQRPRAKTPGTVGQSGKAYDHTRSKQKPGNSMAPTGEDSGGAAGRTIR
jgi:hypothetical protein